MKAKQQKKLLLVQYETKISIFSLVMSVVWFVSQSNVSSPAAHGPHLLLLESDSLLRH